MYIALAGIIGAGKTTLAQQIEKYFRENFRKKQVFTFLETPEDNAFLPAYYAGYDVAFKMEAQFMAQRLDQSLAIDQALGNGQKPIVIQDRSSIEDYHVFAQHQVLLGQLTHEELKSLFQIHAIGANHLAQPDVMLFVDTHPEVALDRVRSRGRTAEDKMTLSFLEDIYTLEKHMINEHMPIEYPDTEVVVLPGNTIDSAFNGFVDYYSKKKEPALNGT